MPYGSSKSGLLGMTRALAAEWGRYFIRVNALAPGYFHTDMTEHFYLDREWRAAMLGEDPDRPLRPHRRPRRRRGLPSLRRRALYHRRLPAGRRRHPRLDLRAMTQINLHDLATLSPDERRRLLTRTEADLSAIEAQVDAIIAAVRDEGDEALARFAREFDKAPVEADAIAATPADFAAAEAALEPEVRAAMEYAAESIRRFHEDQKPEEMWLHEIRPGAFAGERTRPIPSVACYVPRGKGAFPSRRADVDDPRPGRRRARDRHRDPARPRRPHRRRDAGRRPHGRRRPGLQGRRRPGRRRRRLRHRDRPARAPRSSAPAAPGWRRPSAGSPTSSTPARRPARAS